VSAPKSLSRLHALGVETSPRRLADPLGRRGWSVPADAVRRRAQAALPAVDLLVAVGLGALILRPWQVALTYCLVTTPVIGLIEGYSGVPIGGRQSLRSVARLVLAAIVCQWLAFRVGAHVGEETSGLRAILLLVATAGAWSLVRSALAKLERGRPQRVVVVGSGAVTDRLMELIANHSRGRMQILGYLDDSYEGAVHDQLSHLGDIDSLPDVIRRLGVDRVVVAFSACHTDESLLASVRGRDRRRGARALKRAIDVVGSSALLVLTAPVTLTIAVLVWLEDRGPVFYRQERIGRNQVPFHVLKFRSMRRDADKLDSGTIKLLLEGEATIADAVATIKETDDPRVTRIGRLIRKSSLDELPQLVNVLRGEMSLVGPRPLRAFEVASLSDWELARHLERPGITGLWQVSGRSATSWDERMQLDYSYVRHWSLAEDVEILARTLPSVLSRDGAW
jgi:lipopolysaccharide/colanic/teichoic acid biosynthesis glycosyltransferase